MGTRVPLHRRACTSWAAVRRRRAAARRRVIVLPVHRAARSTPRRPTRCCTRQLLALGDGAGRAGARIGVPAVETTCRKSPAATTAVWPGRGAAGARDRSETILRHRRRHAERAARLRWVRRRLWDGPGDRIEVARAAPAGVARDRKGRISPRARARRRRRRRRHRRTSATASSTASGTRTRRYRRWCARRRGSGEAPVVGRHAAGGAGAFLAAGHRKDRLVRAFERAAPLPLFLPPPGRRSTPAARRGCAPPLRAPSTRRAARQRRAAGRARVVFLDEVDALAARS